MSGLNFENDGMLRTCVRKVSRWGTLCGVIAMLTLVTGCPVTPVGAPCPDGVADCDDSDACTTDTCDEADDECEHLPMDLACNDGSNCTTDSCSVTLGCVFEDVCVTRMPALSDGLLALLVLLMSGAGVYLIRRRL